MYQKAGMAFAAGATGGLAWTGANVIWLMLAGFALVAAGGALARIAPRWRSRRS
jgi:hypothetical protein